MNTGYSLPPIISQELLLLFSMLLLSFGVSAQTDFYVSTTGSDANAGTSAGTAFRTIQHACDVAMHGDTVNVLNGVYTNSTYGTWDLWKKERLVRINSKNSSDGQYLVIRSVNLHGAILRGDGDFIVQIRNSDHIRLEGFEVYGEVENIPLDSALKYQFTYRQNDTIYNRVAPGTPDSIVASMTFPLLTNADRPTTINNIGILVQNCNHITIQRNKVHHNTGTGIRFMNGDYFSILDNEVFDNSRRSSVGNHGMVIHSSTSIDTSDDHKIIIARNKVYRNFNEVYSWSENKTFITPHIDEGKGISMQKNTSANGWTHGRIWIVNNLTYRNGLSGIHINEGRQMDVMNNTSFHNHLYGTGNNIGISVADADDIKVLNNISVADSSWNGFAMSTVNSTNLEWANNLALGLVDPDVSLIDTNTIKVASLASVFTDTIAFEPPFGKPAIDGSMYSGEQPADDFYGNTRIGTPDLGAVEFYPSTADDVVIWNGSNWLGGNGENEQPTQPDNGKSLHIYSGDTASVNEVLEILSLTLNDGACLKLGSQACLTSDSVYGSGWMILSGTSADQYAQYTGPAVDSTVVEMIIEEAGWHGLSSPVRMTVEEFESQNATPTTLVNITNDTNTQNLWYYDNQVSGGQNIGVDGSTAYGTWKFAMPADSLHSRGFYFYVDKNFTTLPVKLIFRGASIDQPIVRPTYPDFGGWSLVPNPFTSSLDWNEVVNDGGLTTGNLSNSVYVYNPGANNYRIYDGSGITINGSDGRYIARGQAFYVHRSDEDTTGGLSGSPATGMQTMFRAMPGYRATSCVAAEWLKTSEAGSYARIRIRSLNSNSTNEFLISQSSSYSDAYVVNEDVPGPPSIPGQGVSWYLRADNRMLSIDRIESGEGLRRSIEAHFAGDERQDYEVTLVEASGDILSVELEHLFSTERVTLHEPYIFTAQQSDAGFTVHINGGESVSADNNELRPFKVLVKHNGLEVRLGAPHPRARLQVQNLLGQVLYSEVLNNDQIIPIPLDARSPDILLISLTNQESYVCEKIIR